jgi:glycosyltransferase involved in cell wall biosynthesis
MERLALGRVDAAFYASEWAARSAIEDYQLPAEKTHVVPFGANLQQVPSLEQVTQWVAAKPPSICHLLFVGVDFIRKGGSLAVDVARILNQRGQPTILHLVGLERIPREVEAPFIRNYGFLSKHRAADQVVLEKLWRQSHFLIVPSLAECAGIVYAEASAHGMPSLARDTGGVSAMVKHQTNGFLLAANQEATDYATCIQSCLSDGNEYRRLSLSSYRFFEQCLNWDTAGRAMFETMARRTHGNASDSKLKAG